MHSNKKYFKEFVTYLKRFKPLLHGIEVVPAAAVGAHAQRVVSLDLLVLALLQHLDRGLFDHLCREGQNGGSKVA